MNKDLNIIYAYKVKVKIKYSPDDVRILRDNPIKHHDDWSKSCFKSIKAHIKSQYYLPQKRRCAYCRKKLNTDAYYEHIDHIIPKSHHKGWMFKPKNLTITCEMCNFLKNADDTLMPLKSKTRFPKQNDGFTIFNPHFDRWEEHFEIEDGMFIKGKNLKGQETIRICKLYQYQYCVQFCEESEVEIFSTVKKATLRQRNFPTGTVEHQAAMKVIDYYMKLI